MIKIEKTDVYGFETAVRAMRNSWDSWEKSDSEYETFGHYELGKSDKALMQKLIKAGDDHAKFMRFITVTCDITAPAFWLSQFDTYKVGTVRNSCSFMHTGASKPFNIRDFEVEPKIYDVLDPIKIKKEHKLIHPECSEDDFRLYKTGEREYKVYRNGRIISCAYEVKEGNRVKHFKEREVIPSQKPDGYYELNLGGRRNHEKWALHRLVAFVWLGTPIGERKYVNHIDGNKGNNSVDNLEWVTAAENNQHAHDNGLDGRTIHTNYVAWKNGRIYDDNIVYDIMQDYRCGVPHKTIAEKLGLKESTVDNIISRCNHSDGVFEYANIWEKVLTFLNSLREEYLSTSDEETFETIRRMLPMGYLYKSTVMLNYQVLRHIYKVRKCHRLTEWHEFCEWIESLPYSELITE